MNISDRGKEGASSCNKKFSRFTWLVQLKSNLNTKSKASFQNIYGQTDCKKYVKKVLKTKECGQI